MGAKRDVVRLSIVCGILKNLVNRLFSVSTQAISPNFTDPSATFQVSLLTDRHRYNVKAISSFQSNKKRTKLKKTNRERYTFMRNHKVVMSEAVAAIDRAGHRQTLLLARAINLKACSLMNMTNCPSRLEIELDPCWSVGRFTAKPRRQAV